MTATATKSMRAYALAKTSRLLDDAASAINAAGSLPEMETVHKMRVAIRRLQQAFRLFGMYLRKSGVNGIKDELREIMRLAGELRNYDIAIGLINNTRGDLQGLTKDLAGERLKARQQLVEGIRPFANAGLSLKWHSRLGLKQE